MKQTITQCFKFMLTTINDTGEKCNNAPWQTIWRFHGCLLTNLRAGCMTRGANDGVKEEPRPRPEAGMCRPVRYVTHNSNIESCCRYLTSSELLTAPSVCRFASCMHHDNKLRCRSPLLASSGWFAAETGRILFNAKITRELIKQFVLLWVFLSASCYDFTRLLRFQWITPISLASNSIKPLEEKTLHVNCTSRDLFSVRHRRYPSPCIPENIGTIMRLITK